MQYQLNQKEHLFNIYRIKAEESDGWNPGVEDVADHEIDPVWVASVLYTVYTRYIDSIPEENQIEFEQKTKSVLSHLFENGHNFTDKIS